MQPIDSDSITKLTAALDGMQDFIFLETCRLSPENSRSFLLTDPVCWLECAVGENFDDFFQRAEAYRTEGCFLAGWFGYELGYMLEPVLHRCLWPTSEGSIVARLGVFKKPLIYDHASGGFSGGEGWPVAEDARRSCTVDNLQTSISGQEFLAGVEAIQQYIRAGDTYQVNYTFKLDFSYSGSVGALYRQLRQNQSVAYGAWMRCRDQDILSFSPELFFAADLKGVRVRPMKGTIKRGQTGKRDIRQANKLRQDAKSRSENVMIVDLLRNDLARLLHDSGGGRVRVRSLFDVESYESLLQMTSTIEGTVNNSRRFALQDVIGALFPCGSVTGAPKIRTMEIIRGLEKEPRGVYCGAIGYCSPDAMCFNVPIRTLTLNNGTGSMGVGAGIVHDSDPESEWRECLLKGRFLTHQRPDFQLIETLCWHPDQGYALLYEHLERLSDSARYFFFQADIEAIRYRLRQEADTFSRQAMRVRLLLYKDGRIEVHSNPLVSVSQDESSLPLVAFSADRVEAEDVFLYHKTTLREVYDRERNKAEEQGLYEILFVNTMGEVTEGTISTLFIEKNGKMYTPALTSGLLPGTFRRSLLEADKAEERVLRMGDILGADAIYVANSVRGLVRVQLVEGLNAR